MLDHVCEWSIRTINIYCDLLTFPLMLISKYCTWWVLFQKHSKRNQRSTGWILGIFRYDWKIDYSEVRRVPLSKRKSSSLHCFWSVQYITSYPSPNYHCTQPIWKRCSFITKFEEETPLIESILCEGRPIANKVNSIIQYLIILIIIKASSFNF